MHYDPDKGPNAKEWLAMDEILRSELVAAYHRRKRLKAPKPQLHAVIHTTVENQLAAGEEVVIDAMTRLRKEGLSRHDAIHAIGSVLIAHIHKLLSNVDKEIGNAQYFEALKALTAEGWLNS